MLDAEPLDRPAFAGGAAEPRTDGCGPVITGLTSLLRQPVGSVALEDVEFLERWAPREPLAPPRGIGLAFALCLPIWTGIGALLLTII